MLRKKKSKTLYKIIANSVLYRLNLSEKNYLFFLLVRIRLNLEKLTFMSSGVRKSASAVLTKSRSPFQLKILALYADFIRLSRTTPGRKKIDIKPFYNSEKISTFFCNLKGLLEKVRTGFRSNAHLSVKNDSLTIDYKLRRARNQLDMLKTSRTTSIKTFKF
jgi:hypothetical protein